MATGGGGGAGARGKTRVLFVCLGNICRRWAVGFVGGIVVMREYAVQLRGQQGVRGCVLILERVG